MTPSPGAVNRFDIAFPARVNEIGAVFSVIDMLARWQATPASIVYGIQVVVDELLANVVEHAEAPDGAKILFSLELAPETLAMRFGWPGVPFDPTGVPGEFKTPRLDRNPMTGLGLGLPLVKAFAHEMRYRREADRNVVEVVRAFGEQPDTFIGATIDSA